MRILTNLQIQLAGNFPEKIRSPDQAVELFPYLSTWLFQSKNTTFLKGIRISSIGLEGPESSPHLEPPTAHGPCDVNQVTPAPGTRLHACKVSTLPFRNRQEVGPGEQDFILF